ncbi:hypothetical protein DPMN_002686 [Dreissena polymorpha]|uniref:Uncharacterized protein n=1 Tax=Dreissena polymorpha TaxID=45954 RepID=A0A9D4MP79_DREPO|nr:hypothetical protein DPMN_002686 [Dreissena polymorpha]
MMEVPTCLVSSFSSGTTTHWTIIPTSQCHLDTLDHVSTLPVSDLSSIMLLNWQLLQLLYSHFHIDRKGG